MARWRSPDDIRFSHRLEALGIRLGVRRSVTVDNIRRARVTDDDSVTTVAHETYRNMGRTFAEYARLPRTTEEELRARVRFEGLEHMTSALARGKGVVAVSGHFGSLELMATAFKLIDARPTLLVAPMRNPLATRFFESHRSAYGVDVVEVGPKLREAFRVLRAGGLLCLATDQDAGRHGVFVDFLGRPASTASGAIELAMRTGAPLVFGLCFREGRDRHRAVIHPPVDVRESGPRDAVIREHLERIAGSLEDGIRERPDHWLWLHRRWKTRPVASD